MSHYRAKFSHELEASKSGPARSYWMVNGPGMAAHCGSICLHHRKENDPQAVMVNICTALEAAYEAGRKAKATEVRQAIGL